MVECDDNRIYTIYDAPPTHKKRSVVYKQSWASLLLKLISSIYSRPKNSCWTQVVDPFWLTFWPIMGWPGSRNGGGVEVRERERTAVLLILWLDELQQPLRAERSISY